MLIGLDLVEIGDRGHGWLFQVSLQKLHGEITAELFVGDGLLLRLARGHGHRLIGAKVIVWLEVNVYVIKLVLAHLPEEVREGDQRQEGEQRRERVLEQVRADCVRGDLIGLNEGIEGDKSDESDWRADDAYDCQVRGAQTEQRDKLFHVMRRGQEV